MKRKMLFLMTCLLFLTTVYADEDILVTKTVTGNFVPLSLKTEKGQTFQVIILREQIPLWTSVKKEEFFKLETAIPTTNTNQE